MYLVKSCKSNRNPNVSKTIRIGSLAEYRHTEEEQIADREEGFLSIEFSLENQYISIDLFNHLNGSHGSELSAQVDSLSVSGSYLNDILVSYDAIYRWKNLNRFMFCITKIENPEDSTSIFSEYDDYWVVSVFHQAKLLKQMEDNLLAEVKKKLINGDKVFNVDVDNIDSLTVKSYGQSIIYGSRVLYLNNDNINAMTDTLISLFDNVKFIKPESFRHERELRFIFDFYLDGRLIYPVINSVIISSDGCHSYIQ